MIHLIDPVLSNENFVSKKNKAKQLRPIIPII